MEKLKVIKAHLFPVSEDVNNAAYSKEAYIPIDAISYIDGNGRVYFKKDYSFNAPFPIKSVQATMPIASLEVIK